MTPTSKHAYIGCRPCGCIESIIVIDPATPSITLDALDEMHKNGLIPRQVSVEEADRRGLERCPRHRSVVAEKGWA